MDCLKVIRALLLKFLDLELRVAGLVLVFLMTAAAAPAAELADNKNLFFIKRNKNNNEVHYDARVKNCVWWSDPELSDPEVDSYWRDLQVGPNTTSEIKFWETPAYGFNVNRLSDSEIVIRLRALPERTITARLSLTAEGDCSVSITTDIRGMPAELSAVYVFAEEKFFFGFIPRWAMVDYIYILGYSKDDQPVFDRIIKTEKGKKLSSSSPNDSHWESGATSMGRP